MSSAQMRDSITQELQPCNFPTNLHLSPPSHNLKSGLYTLDKSQSPGYWQHQASAATPTPGDENLQAPRYHDHSCDRLMQKNHVPSEHLVLQTDVSKHGTLVGRSQQNSCLQGSVNNASGPQRREELYESRLQKDHWYAESSKPCGKDDLGRARARDPGQGTAAAVVSLGAMQPPGAPPMRPVPLPGQEADEDISYYGPKLAPGSWLWLTGTVQVDNVQEVPSHLDMALPVPFA